MDKNCTIIQKTLEWVEACPSPPAAYIAEDRIRVSTAPHPYIEFGLHAGGTDARMQVAHRTISATAGTLVILNAHFGNYGTPDGDWRYWCLSLDVGPRSPLQEFVLQPLLLARRVNDLPRLVMAYENLAGEFRRPGLQRDRRVKGALILLLATMFETATDEGAPGVVSSPIGDTLHWIHWQYNRPELTLADLSRAAHLSEAHFGRLFRSEIGIPPMKYLTRYRMERARELLRRTRLHIAEIAAAVGFTDPGHFSRVFHRSTGRTPREFRANENQPPALNGRGYEA